MTINKVLLNSEEIYTLLEEVAYHMPSEPMLELVIVGGTALSIYFPNFDNDDTTDADVFDKRSLFLPESFLACVRKIGKEHGIGEDWLNDAVMRHNDSKYEHNLTHREYVEFIENYDSPEYFYNENGDVVFCLYHLSLLGLIASKLIAGRAKDYKIIGPILRECYNDVSELENDFHDYALSFVSSPRYRKAVERAKELLEQNC